MGNLLSPLKTWKFWKELIILTLGIAIGAAATYYFMVPGKLVIGSVAGLAIVITSLLEGVGISLSVSMVVLILNIILLALALGLIGKEFGFKTIYTSLIMGPLMGFYEKVLPYENLLAAGQTSVMGDPWLDLLCFALFGSIGQAVLFHINASSGGLDIVAKIINKYFHLDLGTSVTVAGAVVCLSAFAINPPKMVILGLIGTWLNGLVIDYFSESLTRKKRVCIISDDSQAIRDYIINQLHRGCSLYPMKGGYKNDDHVEIQTILTMSEFANLLEFLKENEISHFLTAGNVHEVHGKWHNRNISNKSTKIEDQFTQL